MNWLNGIVAIIASDGRIVGTGFVVSAKGYIVTCSHLLSSSVVQSGRTVRIRFKATGAEMIAYIEPRWHSPVIENDLTVLYVVNGLPPEVSVLPLVASQATLDHPFRTWGYPDTQGVAGWNGTGQIKGFTEENNRPRLQFSSKEITRGFSGGPLWNDTLNGVMGVVRMGIDKMSRPQQAGLAVPSEALVRLCDELTLQTPTPSPDLQLPLDKIPSPGNLPPGSRVVHRYNRFFVGRESELQALARLLQAGTTAAIGEVAGITGMGGVGKSQLAIALAYRYGRFFPGGVYWVSFANPDAIENEMALCGGLEGMNLREDFASLELAVQVALVQREWQKPVPRFLIFDNCENELLLEEYRPKVGGCRVIVTSRKGNWSRLSGVQNVPLDTLPRTESITLLRKHVPEGNSTDLDVIAAELGDLPLALHLAGSYLEQSEGAVTPQGYLQRIRTKGVRSLPALQGEGVDRSPTQHELSVWRTFDISYAGLLVNDAVHHLAQQMLACAAWFQPGEPIPVWLLDVASFVMEMLASQEGGSEAVGEVDEEDEQLRLVQARRRLVGLGLVMGDGKDTVTLHRLVGAYVRGTVGAEEARQAVERVAYEEANRLNNAGFPAPLLAWQNHLRHITDAAIQQERKLTANLTNELGYYLHSIGDYPAAYLYYERALAINEKSLGPYHPSTGQSLNNLGSLLQAMGDYPAAYLYYERALAINEKSLGPYHPSTGQSLNNLGALLQTMGDYPAAYLYYERALAINERVLGSEHPSTAINLNNLGALLRAMGDYATARPYYERALTIREKALGPNHPDTAGSLHNLGILLQAMGNYAAAHPYYERALTIREKVLGPDHPHTAESLNTLGFFLRAMGNYAAARPYYERALTIREKALGPNHPVTAESLNNLGRLFDSIGDYTAARSTYERALAIYEKTLGPDHPGTAMSLNNLGALLQEMGDYPAARLYYERALAIYEKTLEPDHPNTATSLNNLGMLCFYEGDLRAAAAYLRQALAIFEKQLGPNHPDTKKAKENLAFVEARL